MGELEEQKVRGRKIKREREREFGGGKSEIFQLYSFIPMDYAGSVLYTDPDSSDLVPIGLSNISTNYS